jgi:hypothetical protein
MGSKTLGLCRPQAGRSAALDAAPELPACPPAVVAQVLTALLSRPVTDDEVVARAVGLGLLRQPAPAQPARLSAQAVSRLFLAGYCLPAHVEAGTLRALHGHLAAGRDVFVLLQEPVAELLRVRAAAGDLGLLVGATGPSAEPARVLSQEAFTRAWAAAGNYLITATRRWADLPAEGRAFFGGTRERDGTYHWDTAECATDAEGRILRC